MSQPTYHERALAQMMVLGEPMTVCMDAHYKKDEVLTPAKSAQVATCMRRYLEAKVSYTKAYDKYVSFYK